VALKLPQADAGVHDHVTPRFWLSFVTIAAICAVALTASEVGGTYCPLVGNVTVITGVLVMVIVACANALLLATDVAVMVTVLPDGTLAGAV
jgi:hypothetical protein